MNDNKKVHKHIFLPRAINRAAKIAALDKAQVLHDYLVEAITAYVRMEAEENQYVKKALEE